MNARSQRQAAPSVLLDLTEEAMLCRDLGHVWRPFRAEERPRNGGYIRTMRCRTCGCQRRQYLDQWGGVTSNSYSYPDGYLLAGRGFSMSDRQELRLWRVRELIEQGDGDG